MDQPSYQTNFCQHAGLINCVFQLWRNYKDNITITESGQLKFQYFLDYFGLVNLISKLYFIYFG